jgi:hypothetical protein
VTDYKLTGKGARAKVKEGDVGEKLLLEPV